MSLLDDRQRVLLVHAHPDDETLSTGSLAVHLVRMGRRVAVVTATRGERGDVVEGPLRMLQGTEALVVERERELANAVSALGVQEQVFLGTPPARFGSGERRYRDSGMRWVTPTVAGPAEDADPGSFTGAGIEDAVADLGAFVEAWQPDLMVTYDAHGGYGHPDHVRTHEITVLVGRLTGVDVAEVLTREALAETTDSEVERLDLEETRDAVVDALRCHASQLTVVDNHHLMHVGGQPDIVVVEVGLRLLG